MSFRTRRAVLSAAAAFTLPALLPGFARAAFTVGPGEFRAIDGSTSDVVYGEFQVPEKRGDPASRTLTLRYARFPATTPNPGPPLVYLAGGPGGPGTGTAMGPRFPIFQALRQVGDVIAFDQRGTGYSNQIPRIRPAQAPELSLTRDGMTDWYRAEIVRCFGLWRDQGIAMEAYNTVESAHDLDDLRRHLGADRIDLWGISYGTHLAQAALKYHGDRIGRVALASLEGLDQTVKLPARLDGYLERVAALIRSDPAARAACPDLVGLMRKVHARLDAAPPRVSVVLDRGAPPTDVEVGAFPLQLMAGGLVKNPSSLVRLPGLYAKIEQALDKADAAAAGRMIALAVGRMGGVGGMSDAMDMASGISAARLARVEAQAKTAVLGDALNFPMPHVRGAVAGIELDDSFRAPFRTRIPALLISGSLDGRTPLAEQRVVGEQFADKRWLTVENAGHDVLETTPEVAKRLVAFFRGERLADETIALPPVSFAPG